MAKAGNATPRVRSAAETVAAFRSAIEQALQDGVGSDDMTLRLTLGDAANLRKDRNIPVTDISFADGEMRLLGVRVISGGITSSTLELTTES